MCKKDKNGYYVDEKCKTKWRTRPPAFGIGFRIIKGGWHEDGYRIIEEFEILEVSICQSGPDSDTMESVADQNREAAQSPVIPPVKRKGVMPEAKNPNAGKKKTGEKKKAGDKDAGQQKLPEAIKIDKRQAVKSWKQGIESKAGQVKNLRALISRTTQASIEIVRIGQEMNRFGNPMNDAIDDLRIEKKGEKAIESQGSMIGAMTQAVGIIEEKIARDLDNPPDGVDATELKKLRTRYYPDDTTKSRYPRLDAGKDKPDKPDKPTAEKKKKGGDKPTKRKTSK